MPFFAVEVKFTGWEKDGLLEQKRNGKWNNNNNNNNSNINRTKSHAAQHSCFTLNEWCPVSSWAAATSLLFPQFIYWAWHHMVWNIPLASGGQLFWLTVLPTSLLDGGVVWEAEKSLTHDEHCSAKLNHQNVINIFLLLDLKHRTIPATSKKINSIPSETRSIFMPCSVPFMSCQGPTGSNASFRVFLYTYADVIPLAYRSFL